MTDVRIPEPGRTAVTSPSTITGTLLVGQAIPGDSYVDYPLALDGGSGVVKTDAVLQPDTGTLELPQGTAELLVGVSRDDIVQVDITGYLDLTGDTTEVTTVRQVTVVVTATGKLDLATDTAVLTTERNVTVVTADQPLDLDGGPVRLVIEVIFRIAVDAVIQLDLFGGPVHVNPVLMPFGCLDLDLGLVTVTDIDLAVSACEPLDLTAITVTALDLTSPVTEVIVPEPIVCLEA